MSALYCTRFINVPYLLLIGSHVSLFALGLLLGARLWRRAS